jgi:probable HAF family extracellular repeat protein
MKLCKWLLAAVLVLALMMSAIAADAPTLTFKFKTTRVPGALTTTTGGINNSGVMVGNYLVSAGGNPHGFMVSGKKWIHIDYPKAVATICKNINSDGAIVGNYQTSKGATFGFLYQNGAFTSIPGPAGALSSSAYGINDDGVIVGSFRNSRGLHGFRLTGSTYKILNVPTSTATIATGINNKGHIVLYWQDAQDNTESSIWNGKTYKTIDVPGASNSLAMDLDNADDVVYQWFDQQYQPHGELLKGGTYYEFNYPKSMGTYGLGINDEKVVVGLYAPDNDYQGGFVATY